MCPDEQLISTYHDDEIPENIKKQFDAHIAECPECKKELEHFSGLSAAIKDSGLSVGEQNTMKNRIWTSLQSYGASKKQPARIWSRRINMPLPVVMAAAILICLLGTGLIVSMQRNNQILTQKSDWLASIRGKASQAYVQSFQQNSNGLQIQVKLPAGSSFNASGEPLFIRAKDLQGDY